MKACLVFCWSAKMDWNYRQPEQVEFLQFLPTTVFNMKQKITTEIYVEDYKLTKVMTNNQKSQAFLSCNLTEIVIL